MMRDMLTIPEVKYLLTGVSGVAVATVIGALAWMSPLSPVALERPADLLANGHVAEAMVAYERLAGSFASDAVREEASWRLGLLADVEQDDPQAAVEHLSIFVFDFPESRHSAAAYVRLAHLYANELGDPLLAAEHWELAATTDPENVDAGAWLLAAGRAYHDVEENRRAIVTLLAASAHVEHAASAWLTLARIHLSSDPAGAYEYYGEAMRASPSDAERRLARLGMVTALEHLEYRDEALAAVDQALEDGAEDDAALQRRRRRLWSIYKR
jgi:tetratricopeptide (TPR) repeat protein